MAPTMDIDENKAPTPTPTPTPTPATTAKPKKAKVAAPSASSESASAHPDMSLAQDIHRLVMVHEGKLSSGDATSIIGGGRSVEDLLDGVMSRVGTGGRGVVDAIRANGARHAGGGGPEAAEEGGSSSSLGGGGAPPAPAAAVEIAVGGGDGKGGGDDDDDDDDGEPLLNPSLYRHLRSALSYASPSALSESDLDALVSHHESILVSLKSAVTRASDEAGDMEVLSAMMDVARYTARCCAKDDAMDAYRAVLALPKLSAGKRLDAHLEMARVCSFWGDFRGYGDTLVLAARAISKGGDWDRRNRLRVYQALAFLLVRDAESASKLLVEGIATFSCAELCDYQEFVTYAIVTGLLCLKRTELKKSIIDGSEVLQVAKDIPVLIRLANTLYDCHYKAYLNALVDLQPHLVANRYLQPHAGYLLRELHVLAYQQFLDSYQSVTLESMATSFGVGTEFLDVQLSRFIAAGRLTAKIDKYGGVVETNRPDWKNARYQEMIQKGDLLLNRIQKLGRVVDL